MCARPPYLIKDFFQNEVASEVSEKKLKKRHVDKTHPVFVLSIIKNNIKMTLKQHTQSTQNVKNVEFFPKSLPSKPDGCAPHS